MAYPYVIMEKCYNGKELISMLRQAGFSYACTTASIAGQKTDKFRLPRVHVQDWKRRGIFQTVIGLV